MSAEPNSPRNIESNSPRNTQPSSPHCAESLPQEWTIPMSLSFEPREWTIASADPPPERWDIPDVAASESLSQLDELLNYTPSPQQQTCTQGPQEETYTLKPRRDCMVELRRDIATILSEITTVRTELTFVKNKFVEMDDAMRAYARATEAEAMYAEEAVMTRAQSFAI